MAWQYAKLCQRHLLEAKKAAEGSARLHEVLGKHEENLFALSREYFRHTGSATMGEIVTDEINRLEQLAYHPSEPGVMTGLVDLDNLIVGFRPGELVYLAARPGVGKTALALNIANNCRVPVGFFSLEMSAPEIAKRQISLMPKDLQ